MSLNKTLYPLLSTGSTKEDPSRHDWAKRNQIKQNIRERSGTVVECLTGDRGAAGSSLTGVSVLCP